MNDVRGEAFPGNVVCRVTTHIRSVASCDLHVLLLNNVFVVSLSGTGVLPLILYTMVQCNIWREMQLRVLE